MSSTTTTPTAEPMSKARITAFYGTNAAEQHRLHAQHAIGIAAFSNHLLVFPGARDLLVRPNLHILDNAGADGFWLTELRAQLQHPESAELVAADIAPFPGETGDVGVGEGVRLVRQDMMSAWPAEWEGRFDVVHQRACLSFHPTWSSARDATCRLLRLLKPGGYIQLVDGAPPYGPVCADDAPHAKFFKSIGRVWSPDDVANGIDPPIANRPSQLLAEATAAEGVELKDVGEKRGVTKWGRGAASREMEELGVGAVEDLVKNLEALWERSPEVMRVGIEEWGKLRVELMSEVRERGFEIGTAAVWGRRKV